MKVRKLLLSAVAALLAVTFLSGTAIATQPWGYKANQYPSKVKTQVKNNKDKNNFYDLSSNHWAFKRIQAMAFQGVITGYQNGFFCPNASVSKIEALTMILRTEGADLDDLKEALENQDVPKSIPYWAQGYAALAVERGILTEKELKKFQPLQATKRYEAVIYLGRALDIDPDEGDIDDLDFKDLESIPDEALDYLPCMVDKGYFTGYKNGKFMPNKPLTRAEIATILSKVTGDQDDEDNVDIEIIDQFKAKGTIADIEEDTLVLKVKGQEKEFSVDEDVIVFLDNKESDYDKLEEGYTALVLCDSDKEALVIYAHSKKGAKEEDDNDEDIETVKGIFKSLSNDEDEIKVLVNGNLDTFDVDDDAAVEIDGEDADLDDLLPGTDVKLTIEDDEVVEIDAEELEEISGRFVSYDEEDNELVLKIEGEGFTFQLASDVDVDIEIEGDNIQLEDLDEDIDLDLTFHKGEVVEIEGQD